jgi:hypothetical protein
MNDLRVINLSSYTTPKVVEYKNKEWIGYGDDNNYFKYLIDRYNGSPTNNAIVNAVSAMIFGKGLDATDSNRKPDEYAKMISLFNNDCIRKLCYDLKLMGQCSMQIIYSKDRNSIAQVEHFPVETLRAEKSGEDGEINAYYYFHDWEEYKPQSKLKRIPAFGKSNESIEILYVKPYRAGYHYYSPVDYQGGLQYAELEEEVGNFHLNNIMNGMSPSMLINFNNGVPNEEERELIEQRISQKFSGSSNAGKFILAFNDNADTAASIDPVQLSDAHQQYQFLSEESTRKIMVSHRIVSPMLIGIKDQSGLGNNADELKTASILLDNTVIRPFQHLLIDSFDQILDAREYDAENEDIEVWADKNIESKEQQLEKKSIDSKKSGFSYLDKSLYKVRYKYSQKYSSGKSRQFCRIMMARSQRGVVYRLEDIDKASRAGVNKSFGHKGKAYDLFKYKGGVNCGHFFSEVLYRLKSKTMKKKIQNYDEVKSIPKSYRPRPAGHKKAKVAPKDMPNNGHHPNYR